MEINCRIVKSLPEQSGTSKSGNRWRKQEHVVEYTDNGGHAHQMAVTVMGDNIGKFNIVEGGQYDLKFDIDAHEWQGRWFNEFRVWYAYSPEHNSYDQRR